MKSEILLHIKEELDDGQRQQLMLALGNRPGYMEPHLHSVKEHMMFVAYDPEQLCPHDLVAMAEESGVHATTIEF